MDLSAVRRWWPLGGVTALLAVVALAAAHSSPQLHRVELPGARYVPDDTLSPQPAEETSEPAKPGGQQFEPPDWLTTVALGLCALVVAAVVGLLLWVLIRELANRSWVRHRARSSPSTGPLATRTTEEVVAALDAGLVNLSDADTDPRRAVIACWVRLEQAAAAVGTPREAGDSPTDLVTRLLRSHDVSADVLAAFAHVYRQARYATHEIDEQMRGEARSALHRLRIELSQGRPTGAEATR